MSFLSVDNINVFYNEFQALFGVSMSVEKGETVAIIGSNGAGKSTLMRTIAGGLIPTQGSIRYEGTDTAEKTAFEMNRLGIALVPEGRKIFPSLSVEENLKIGGYSGRTGQWTLEKIYEQFPILKERRSNGGTQLSGGQQQMVAIGRALMSNPDLILMDEVSLGLAPIIVNEIYTVVRQIAQTGTTVILVEQDVNRGLREADRFYCLLEGKVSLAGKPTEVDQDQVSKAYFGL
ncbi:MAG: ABC transporter ATP-binding protein [Chloroflexota bacterium]